MFNSSIREYTLLSHHHPHPSGAARCPGSVNKRTACVNAAPVAARSEGAMRLRHQTSRLVAVAVESGYLREMPRGRRGGEGEGPGAAGAAGEGTWVGVGGGEDW